MAYYIKANPLVAEYLKLTGHRTKLKDGNYLLWQADMAAFGPLPQIFDSCRKIGGLLLLPHEAKQEQTEAVTRELPTAEDERFVTPSGPESGEGEKEEEVSNETTESDEHSERDQND